MWWKVYLVIITRGRGKGKGGDNVRAFLDGERPIKRCGIARARALLYIYTNLKHGRPSTV